jgi:IS5 family transposase
MRGADITQEPLFTAIKLDDPVRDHSTFSVNRDRLIHHELLAEVVASTQKQQLLSNDHFSVDG